MRIAVWIASLAFASVYVGSTQATEFNSAARIADLNWLIDQISLHYAYLPERHLDLAKLRAFYRPQAQAATTQDAWLHVIERAVSELHDHHATLGKNTPSSPQLVPTGTDLWAEMRGNLAILTEIRPDSPAAKADLKAGDQVVAINGLPADKAVTEMMPHALVAPDAEAENFVLRTLLAGDHVDERKFSVRSAGGKSRVVTLPPYVSPKSGALVTWRKLAAGIGYIRIENSLGDSATVSNFDAALADLSDMKGLVLDLRNTPSGGNTDVAEPILGRFIAITAPYQRVFDPAPGKHFPEASFLKSVNPRKPLVTSKLVVLVDHWTGSMGEGMTIGLDALHRATIVGTQMAGLSGGTNEFVLPNTGIHVHFPTERLYTVSGIPREKFVPSVLVDLAQASNGDPILSRGLAVLEGKP